MNENQNKPEEQVDVNFFNIVISLSQAAIVAMGKMTNPQTGSVEKNMDLAKVNIDILQMLKEKTKGNLSKKENEIISDTLTNVQLTYADEKKQDDTEKNENGSSSVEAESGKETSDEDKSQ